MNIITDFRDGIRQIIAHAVAQGRGATKKYAVPIYGNKKNAPDQIGTCFLIEHKGHYYLLTAAHVVDESANTTLYVGTPDGFFALEGNFLTTVAPNGDRAKDHFDFAWLELQGKNLDLVEQIVHIPSTQISKNRIDPKSRVYLAVGYPNSRNKVNRASKAVTPWRATYYSTHKDYAELFKKLGVSTDTHIAIEYKAKSLDDQGNVVDSFRPRGISGGPLFDLGRIVSRDDLTRNNILPPLLAGLLIEHHKSDQALVSVKIDFIIDKIESRAAV